MKIAPELFNLPSGFDKSNRSDRDKILTVQLGAAMILFGFVTQSVPQTLAVIEIQVWTFRRKLYSKFGFAYLTQSALEVALNYYIQIIFRIFKKNVRCLTQSTRTRMRWIRSSYYGDTEENKEVATKWHRFIFTSSPPERIWNFHFIIFGKGLQKTCFFQFDFIVDYEYGDWM